jgi:DNA repair exonuclease SbcCD ATPase subunit
MNLKEAESEIRDLRKWCVKLERRMDREAAFRHQQEKSAQEKIEELEGEVQRATAVSSKLNTLCEVVAQLQQDILRASPENQAAALENMEERVTSAFQRVVHVEGVMVDQVERLRKLQEECQREVGKLQERQAIHQANHQALERGLATRREVQELQLGWLNDLKDRVTAIEKRSASSGDAPNLLQRIMALEDMTRAPCLSPMITSKHEIVTMLERYKLGECAMSELMARLDLWAERYAHSCLDYWRRQK